MTLLYWKRVCNKRQLAQELYQSLVKPHLDTSGPVISITLLQSKVRQIITRRPRLQIVYSNKRQKIPGVHKHVGGRRVKLRVNREQKLFMLKK